MIRKYTFGHPIPTDAVVLSLPAEAGPVPFFDLSREGDGVILTRKLQPEDFRHEQYLLAEENGKRILFSGCSHRGILNIMHWFQPDVLIGGFHLSKLPLDETLASFADRLNTYPTTYYTCHCTGTEQYRFMQSRMKNLHYISAGDSITL